MLVARGDLKWSTAEDSGFAASGDVSNATLYTLPIRLDNISLYSVQLTTTGGGSPTGTFKIQVSDSRSNELNDGIPSPAPSAMKWTDLASATSAFTVDATKLIDVSTCPHLWFRLVWTKSSGTGTVTGLFVGKGNV